MRDPHLVMRLHALMRKISTRTRLKSAILYFIVVGNFLSLISPGFGSPAHFYYDENLLIWSAEGIAHMVWGLGVTKGQLALFTNDWFHNIMPLMGNRDALQIILERTRTAPSPVFLGRYPPGIGLTLYLFFSIFGLHFWVARMATTIFHIGTLILFTYNLKRLTKGFSLAAIGGFLFSTVPMSSYFGRLVVDFIPALFFMTLAVTFYSSSYRQKSVRSRLVPALLALCFACFYNWVGFILFAFLLLFELRRSDRSGRNIAAVFIVFMSMLVLLIVPLVLTGVSIGGYRNGTLVDNLWLQFQIFVHRTFLSTQNDAGQPFTVYQWVTNFISVNVWGFTLLVPPLAICGLGLYVRRVRRRPLMYVERVNGILGLVGVSFVALLAQGVYVHMYYQYFLLPGEVYLASTILNAVYSQDWGLQWVSKLFVICALASVYYLARVTIFGTFI